MGSLDGLIPQGFPGLVRVLNPASAAEGRKLRWSRMAGESMSIDSETQWSDIVISLRWRGCDL